MRAIRVHETGGPEVLRLDTVPDPTPAAGELLVDVEAIGINFIEIYQREGWYPLPRPFIPGAEAAGTVRAVGSGVTDFVVGDFMTEAVFPSLLHQDPRYFRRGTGGGWARLGAALGQMVWTHADRGGSADGGAIG